MTYMFGLCGGVKMRERTSTDDVIDLDPLQVCFVHTSDFIKTC